MDVEYHFGPSPTLMNMTMMNAMLSTLALWSGGMVPSSSARSRSCQEMHLDVRRAQSWRDKRFRDLQKRCHFSRQRSWLIVTIYQVLASPWTVNQRWSTHCSSLARLLQWCNSLPSMRLAGVDLRFGCPWFTRCPPENSWLYNLYKTLTMVTLRLPSLFLSGEKEHHLPTATFGPRFLEGSTETVTGWRRSGSRTISMATFPKVCVNPWLWNTPTRLGHPFGEISRRVFCVAMMMFCVWSEHFHTFLCFFRLGISIFLNQEPGI